MRWMLDQTALGRSHTKQPAAESKLLSGALALGADVVCVAEEPGPGPRLAVALGAVNIWIAPQGHVVDADGASQDHKKTQRIPTECPRPPAVEQVSILPQE